MNRKLLNELNREYIVSFEERPDVDFKITSVIGRGASCVVYHAICSDNTEHLLKEYYPQNLSLQRSEAGTIIVPIEFEEVFDRGLKRFHMSCDRQKEIRLSSEGLKNFTCNVQGYYKANGTEYIDMTCFNGQTYNNVQEKSLYNLMLRMKTLTQVINNYHKAGFLHLDIKPENIYVRPEDQTVEDVMLFDFDSVISIEDLQNEESISCSKQWAAQEQLSIGKRSSICYATDLFAIGEIIFVQIFGRHSTNAERRSFVRGYTYDYNAEIFKNMNPKAFPLLDELLYHTICSVVERRYQSAEELLHILNQIIKITNPEAPYLKSNLPAVQDFFVGRDDEIEEIHQKLTQNQVLFLSGIGGIGKSELAKHYAHDHKEDYDVIVFATYNDSWNALIKDQNSVNITNFEYFPEENEGEFCERKLLKLKELCDERTLFIIDNLNEDIFQNENEKYWKAILGLGCKLLFTTRINGWGFPELEIRPIKNIDSLVELFDKYYKIKNDIEKKDIVRIINYVSKHTLTVELIAKQIHASFYSPSDMLQNLKEYGLSMDNKESVVLDKNNARSKDTIQNHISALFDMAKLNEEEKYVLVNMAMVPPDGIESSLFKEWSELEDFNVVNDLATKGWLEKSENKLLKMHPIIADIIRAKCTEQSRNMVQTLFASCNRVIGSGSNMSPVQILATRITMQMMFHFRSLASEEVKNFDGFDFDIDSYEKKSNNKTSIIILSAIWLLFFLVGWMMIKQPLMGANFDGELVSGSIDVYVISWFVEYGAQGVLNVVFPLLMLGLVYWKAENHKKLCACYVLVIANILAYFRSLLQSRQWLITEVSWDIEYYVGYITYPAAMICLAVLVLIWLNICQYYEEVNDENIEK